MSQAPLLFLLLALGILYLVIGARAARQSSSNEADYYVAGRNLGVLQISCNLIATQLGGGLLLGTAASAYAIGLMSLSYPLGIVLGCLILGCGVAEKIQQVNAVTTAQVFEIHYGSTFLKKLASFLSITTLLGILIAQVICLRNLVVTLGYSEWVAIVFWVVITLYTVVGGLRAITINDLIQLSILSATFGFVFFWHILTHPGALSQISDAYINGTFLPIFPMDKNNFSVIIIPALFCLIEQDMAQRFFASRTQAVAKKSAIIAGIYLLCFSFIPAYFGIILKIKSVPVPANGSPLMIFLQNNSAPLLCAIAICAVFAAIISTADSLINGISANVTQDFQWQLTPKMKRIFPKLISFGVGVIALVSSFFTPQNVVDVIISSYELSVSGLLVPLLYAYYSKNKDSKAAFCSIALGVFTFFILSFLAPIPFKVLFSLLMSLVGFHLARYLKTPQSKERLQ